MLKIFLMICLIILVTSATKLQYSDKKQVVSEKELAKKFIDGLSKGNKLMKKWINTPVTIPTTTLLSEADNSPWFADYTSVAECVGSITQFSHISMNGFTKSSISGYIKGGVGSTLCLNLTINGLYNIVEFKIAEASLVHELQFGWHCGDFRLVESWPGVDRNKPKIMNGISCSCPLGGDPQFTACDAPNVTDHFSYQRRMPWGDKPSSLELCHNLLAMGPAKGCPIREYEQTDYYLKLKSTWDFYPVFKVKTRDVLEVVLQVSLDGVPIQNISLSELDPAKFAMGYAGFTTVAPTSIDGPQSTLSDYVIFSQEQNFTSVDKIYLAHTEMFNYFSEFNPRKLCAIKKEFGTTIYDQIYRISDSLSDTFLGDTCYSTANGTIQPVFPRLANMFTPLYAFSTRFDPSTFALQPGESSLLKQNVEVALSLSITTDNPVNADGYASICSINTFSFSCDDSVNLEGFKCIVNVDIQNDGQISIKSQDAQSVILNYFGKSGKNQYQIIVNPIYVSDKQVTLCATCTYNDATKCQTTALNYTIDVPTDQPNVIDPDNHGDTHGDGGLWTGKDGKLKGWAIGLISAFSIIGAIILIYLMWPLIVIVGKGFIVVAIKARKGLGKMGKNIEEAHDQEKMTPSEETKTLKENQVKFIG
jgi:hypothetical protein